MVLGLSVEGSGKTWYDRTMSANELLDIVDDQNRPTGQVVARVQAHALDLRHRTVHIYVFRKRGETVEVLAHLRSPLKDHSPNTWDPRFGGHITHGQEPRETSLREMEEEAGLAIKADDLITGPVLRWDEPTNNEYNHVFGYNARDLNVSTLRFKDGEVQAVKWISIQDVLAGIQAHPKEWSGGAALGSVVERIRDWLVTL